MQPPESEWLSLHHLLIKGLTYSSFGCVIWVQVVYLSIVSDIAKSEQTHDANMLHAYYVTYAPSLHTGPLNYNWEKIVLPI
jgi:hypothetical protein